MEIEFLKMQGIGNDYIILDGFKNQIPDRKLLPRLAAAMCDRRRGIGADGLVLILDRAAHELAIELVGSRGEPLLPCPTAIRLAGRYAYDGGLVLEKKFQVTCQGFSGNLYVVDSSNLRLEYGIPFLPDGTSELKEFPDRKYTEILAVEGRDYSFTPLFLHTPHVAVFMQEYGDALEGFAKKTLSAVSGGSKPILEFIRVYSRDELKVRVFVPGQGEVPASGIGAAAGFVAAAVNGFIEREALVHLSQGDLFLEWGEEDGMVCVTGPADYVFTGAFYFDEEDLGEGSERNSE